MQRIEIGYEEFRTLVIEAIQTPECISLNSLRGIVPAIARKRGVLPPEVYQPNFIAKNLNYSERHLNDADQSRATDIIWDLIIEGVLRPGSHRGDQSLPDFHLTDWGAEKLKNGTNNPYDPDGFLKRLRVEIPNLDNVIFTYLQESLHTFRIGCMLSSTITLGAAAEKAFLLLIDSYIAYLPTHLRQAFEDKIKGRMIKRQFEIMKDRLDSEIRPRLDDDTLEGMDVELNALFDFIRNQRNDAGHPKGVTIERERAYSNLTVVPVYLKKVYDLIKWLSTNQHPAQPVQPPAA